MFRIRLLLSVIITVTADLTSIITASTVLTNAEGDRAKGRCTLGDASVLLTCYNDYMSHFGMSIDLLSPVLPSAIDFLDYQLKRLDTAGGYCMPYLLFQACISQLPARCMSVHGLSMITGNETDAAVYFVSFLATNYQCGEGYPVLEQNFQCIRQMQNVSDSHCDDFLASAPLDDCRSGLTRTLQCLYNHGQKLCNNDVGQLFCYTFASTYTDTIGAYRQDACPAKTICAEIVQQQQNSDIHINVIPVDSMTESTPGATGDFSTEDTSTLPMNSNSPMTTGSTAVGGSTPKSSIFEKFLNMFKEKSMTTTTSTTPTSTTEAWLSEMFEAKQSDLDPESNEYGDDLKQSGIKKAAIASVVFLAMTMVFLA